MTPTELIAVLKLVGITLRTSGDRLRVETTAAAADLLTDPLQSRLKANRAELLAALAYPTPEQAPDYRALCLAAAEARGFLVALMPGRRAESLGAGAGPWGLFCRNADARDVLAVLLAIDADVIGAEDPYEADERAAVAEGRFN